MRGKWLQRRTEKALPRAAAEKSPSFGKLQRNSRAEALPCSSPRQGQVTEQREPSPSEGGRGRPGGVLAVCGGSSGRRGERLTRVGCCEPPLFMNMFSAQIYSAGRRLLLAFNQGLARGDGWAGRFASFLPPFLRVASPALPLPRAPQRPGPPAQEQELVPRGDGGLGAAAPIQPDPRDGCRGARGPCCGGGKQLAGPLKPFFSLSC